MTNPVTQDQVSFGAEHKCIVLRSIHSHPSDRTPLSPLPLPSLLPATLAPVPFMCPAKRPSPHACHLPSLPPAPATAAAATATHPSPGSPSPPPPPIQELAESGRAAELQPLAPALYQLCVQIPVEASLA